MKNWLSFLIINFKMNTYQLIEDNSGGLHLFVRDSKTNEIIFAGKIKPSDIQFALANINDADLWEEDLNALATHLGVIIITKLSDLRAARVAYHRRIIHDFDDWKLVADENGTYPDNMRYGAKLAFGIE